MTAVTVTAGNISASEERGAVFARYIAGEALTVGQAVYLDLSTTFSPKAYKAIADSSAHATAVGIVVIPDNFAGETTIAAGGTATVCVYGKVWGFSSLATGPLWVDKTTAGSMNTAAPTTAYQFVVGHVLDNETFFVDPGTVAPVSA